MAEKDEKAKEKEKRFTREFVEKWAKTSEKEPTPEEAILEKQRKLLEEDPKNVRVWYARGLFLMDLGRNEESLGCFDRVVELSPTHPGLWNARAEVLRRLGRAAEAAESLQRALEHVAPQVDEKFRKEPVKEETVEDILKYVVKETPPRKAPPRKKEAVPKAAEKALEELAKLEAEAAEVAAPRVVDKEFQKKLETWAAQGYDLEPLRKILESEPYKARTAFFQFEQSVAKIGVLRETLQGIKVPGFEQDIARIEKAMKSPYNMWKIEADVGDLLSKVEARQAEIARGVARPEAKPRVAVRRAPAREVAPPRRERVTVLRPTEGRVNGLAAPAGRTNGFVATGRVNGLVNGLQSARRGLTNGLTDPTGLTNGLGSPRFRREMRFRRWKLYVIPLIATFLILVPLLGAPTALVPSHPGGVVIDGSPDDWSGVSGYTQTQDVPADNVNITAYKSLLRDNILSFLVEVKGMVFGDSVSHDSYYAFIDVDGSATTGYDVDVIGADFMVELTGREASAKIVSLSWFDDSNPDGSGNWSAWKEAGSVLSAASGSTLEFQIETWRLKSLSASFDDSKFQAVVVADNNKGVTSQTAVRMGATYGALIVRQLGGPSTVAGTGVENFLSLRFEAVGSNVHVSQVTFNKSAKTSPVDTLGNFDVVAGQPYSPVIRVDTGLVSFGDFLYLEVLSVDADRPVTIVGEPARAYAGAVPGVKLIDAVFGDWSPSELRVDADAVSPPNLDIGRYGANKTTDDAYAYFYVDVRGAMMAGSDIVQAREVGEPSAVPPALPAPPRLKKGEDLMRVYVDSDSQDNQGAPVLGLPGADYMVDVRGKHGRITQKSFHKWTGGAWQYAGTVKAAKDEKRMEIALNLSGITVRSMQVAFESSNWQKAIDATEVSSPKSRTRSADGGGTTYETFYSVTLPASLTSDSVVRYSAGGSTLEWFLPREVIHVDGGITRPLSSLSPAELLAKDSGGEYHEAYPEIGTDVVYNVDEVSLKEKFVIGRPLAQVLSSESGVVRFTFELRIDPDLMVYVEGSGPQNEVVTTERISFTDGHEERFSIPPAVAWDSGGRELRLPYTWEKAGPSLSIDVPVNYLVTSTYPVYVDPWVNYTIKNTGPLSGGAEYFGNAVAIGDFNNDGYADLLVGAYNNAKNYSGGGAAYIYLGPLTSDKTTPDVNIPGTVASYKKGQAVAAGKFNNDNYWDALVTQYTDKPALIYYGRASWPLWVTTADVTINAQSYGASPGSPRFGFSAAGGNVDGAYYDDVIIGAPGNRNSGSTSGVQDGAAFVFLSPFSSTVTSYNFTLLPPTNSSGQYGSSLAVGLIDGDTKYDVVGGEPYYLSSLGRVSLHKGSSLSSGSGARMPNANVSGRKVGERFGYSVAVGKLNSDSYEDIAVGAPWNGINCDSGNLQNCHGKVYLYLAWFNGITTNQAPNATVVNQSNGEQFGTTVLIGPTLGPSTYNLVAGAPYAAAGGSNRGRVYVFDSPLTSSTPTKTQTGDFDNDLLGQALAGGKFSGDNFYRVAIGNPKWVNGGSTGRVVILSFIPEFADVTVIATSVAGLVLGLGHRRRKRRIQPD